MILMDITGSLKLKISDLNGNVITGDKEVEVLRGLKSGAYIMSLDSRTICSFPKLNVPLFNFTVEVEDGTDYEFLYTIGE